MLPSELTNTIEQFIVYVHRNEAHLIYIYEYHTNVLEADNIYKNPPLNVISPIFSAIFISIWGSTNDSADCCSAHRSPTTTTGVFRNYITAMPGCPEELFDYGRNMSSWAHLDSN